MICHIYRKQAWKTNALIKYSDRNFNMMISVGVIGWIWLSALIKSFVFFILVIVVFIIFI